MNKLPLRFKSTSLSNLVDIPYWSGCQMLLEGLNMTTRMTSMMIGKWNCQTIWANMEKGKIKNKTEMHGSQQCGKHHDIVGHHAFPFCSWFYPSPYWPKSFDNFIFQSSWTSSEWSYNNNIWLLDWSTCCMWTLRYEWPNRTSAFGILQSHLSLSFAPELSCFGCTPAMISLT